MNEYQVLIWHYSSKNERWYDATENVTWYQDGRNSWLVRFKGVKELRHVAYDKMHVFEKPKKVEFLELYYKDSPCFKVKSLLCFNETMYKIFYESGYTCVARKDEIKIVRDVLKPGSRASGVMAYYRRVVQETVEDEEDQFLLQQFDDINYVNEESVLALYLNGKLAKSGQEIRAPIISPFGSNLSQSEALKMMFSNRISIVEGPPGTGKTQTILNFIANAVINGLSIAVVSNNNSATDNVYEKLDKYGYSFIAAPLGNRDNVESFFEEYDSDIPYFERHKVNASQLTYLYSHLPYYFQIENMKKKKEELLDGIELEYKHFLGDNADVDFSSVRFKPEKVKSDNILKVMIKLKESQKELSKLSKFLIRLKLKTDKRFFELDKGDYIVHLNNLYYLSKIIELKNDIKFLNQELNNKSLSEKITEYVSLSNNYFENSLTKIFSSSNRKRYEKDNYKRQFAEFVKDYPVVLSSTYSLAKCSQRGFMFDYLIVDESSQVNMASAILSMRVARNIVAVGDIKQLPQIDDDSFKERNKELLSQFKVPKTYSYYGNSIMSSLLSLYGEKIPKTMLKEHYRCSPEIISFCNKKFYDGELIIYTKSKSNDYTMKVIKTAPGNFARKNPDGSGLYNQREIDEIKELLKRETLEDVGVIAPYRYHTEVAMNQLGDMVDASTIHKFQGREKKTIIFSSVINSSNEFVENDNLINVAVSRAIDKFILVTSDKVAKSNSGVLSDLINYISYNNDFGVSEDGKIQSIYDLLYEDYQKQLTTFRSKHHSKDFDSEILTKDLLDKILKHEEFSSFGLRMHVSLKDFIRARGLHLTDDEFAFYRNPNAHADFLVYNKMSRKPVLVIEVDGVSFHEQQKVQKERDAKKDSIIDKAGLKMLRLKTNESNEELRIKEALNACL
ncbi:MAG: DUF2726 domain-containing protein [Bacilli bacterium]|nr:DUF2726 domain-containing protein [Bacilli bacterium]